MKITFLDTPQRSDSLILIFPGWSCGAELYKGFSFPGWEIAIVEDYSSLSFDTSTLERFSTIYLFAWSIGVFMASTIDFRHLITAAVAINGTLKPADELNGIPFETFVKTADNLTPRNLMKFRRRMSPDSHTFNETLNKPFSEEETLELRKQLYSILDWQNNLIPHPLPWKKVFISESDAIFPFENMKRFWTESFKTFSPKIISLKGSHYIPMEKIVKLTIPEVQTVARRFSGVSSSYNSNAEVQQKMAVLLAQMLQNNGLSNNKRILEIGCGTGLFTQEIIQRFHPGELIMVDIADVKPATGNVASQFYKADAEKWIVSTSEMFDAVLSSATVQWFVNLPLFLKNVRERLTENGILGFSTFLPGNLHELDSLRPSPLHYHSAEEIRKMLEKQFDDIEVNEMEYVLHFDSLRQLFDHLRLTGIGGSAPIGNLPLSGIKNLRTLTYKCGCFIARNKK